MTYSLKLLFCITLFVCLFLGWAYWFGFLTPEYLTDMKSGFLEEPYQREMSKGYFVGDAVRTVLMLATLLLVILIPIMLFCVDWTEKPASTDEEKETPLEELVKACVEDDIKELAESDLLLQTKLETLTYFTLLIENTHDALAKGEYRVEETE